MPSAPLSSEAAAQAGASLLRGDFPDPASFLGLHPDPQGGLVIRAFLPRAHRVEVVETGTEKVLADMASLHSEGLFEARFPRRTNPFPYRFRVHEAEHTWEVEDAFRFGHALGDLDRYLFQEGTHLRIWEKLGAHPTTRDGVEGVAFAVWAPSAKQASVVGDFNQWDGRRHPMERHGASGVWERFIPRLHKGDRYQFELKDSRGRLLPLKSDPLAFRGEAAPGCASVVEGLGRHPWQDQAWMAARAERDPRQSPMSIYEVHLGSWRRGEDGRFLSYCELAESLVPYAIEMGFTHLQLLPLGEHPFYGSWGYQPLSLFAPTERYGSPDELRAFVDICHRAGLGVLLDWVPGHFPEDAHGLSSFDGTHLYDHADPRQGRHADWHTLVYNFGRPEVRNFLIANALYWLEEFHLDGLRVDAVASMLYLDYSRPAGAWIPNQHGGRENLEAVAFLRQLNEAVHAAHPGVLMIAEESTAWPQVSHPTYSGGLGFGFKWNMGWMNDTLRHFRRDPVHRGAHQDELTFSQLYAYTENFVLPLSHDEVVHGKGSLVGKMPGDRWQRFANLRLLLAHQFTHPGKKLLFMGGELGQEAEWDHERALDWQGLEDPFKAGVQRLVRDLNRLHRELPALHELDCEPEGFQWIDCHDRERSVLSFLRRSADGSSVVVVLNCTPVVRRNHRLGVGVAGRYAELLNTDSNLYGGSGVGNLGEVFAEAAPAQGQPFSVSLSLPPLGALVLQHRP